jgi:nucleotide-binding universal stress UspA family protein
MQAGNFITKSAIMKTIIVATDYSKDADNAVIYAAELARAANARLVLLNAYNLSVPGSNTILPVSIIDTAIKNNQAHLKEIADRIAKTYGIRTDHIARVANLKEELNYQAEHLHADLIIMGISRCYEDSIFNSASISIMRHSKYPVLAVPEDASFKGISTILFAYDPDCISSTNKLLLLKEIAGLFNAHVNVYHIEKNKSKATSIAEDDGKCTFDVEAVLKEVGYSYKDLQHNNIVDGIKEEIENTNADLLLMVPHKYSFLESIIHKSKTGVLARWVHIPLLTLPNPAVA